MNTVIIVEDDLSIADLLQMGLEKDGYVVTGIARTLKEAVALAEQQKPAFAVIDIRLANGDLGTAVGAHLRATTDAKILFSTGNGNFYDAMETCGDALMQKPYSLNDVGAGLQIIEDMALTGCSKIPFPRGFRLFEHT